MNRESRFRRQWGVPAVAPALLVGGALFAGAVSAQQPDPEDVFEDETSVFEVQIPVNVVDRSGKPITGLTADDFELIDEGTQQEITSFRTIDLKTLEPGPKRSATPYGDVIPSAARRHILFLFDLTFSDPAALVRARQAAQEFVVSSMHESDLAAVAVHSVDGGPRLVVTFTPDRAQLARAIDTLGIPSLLDSSVRDPLRFVIATPDADGGLIASTPTGGNPSLGDLEDSTTYAGVIGNQMNRMERSQQASMVSSWSASMARMARILGNVEGRKQVVYFTEGFDGRLLLGREPDTTDPAAAADTRNLRTGRYHLVDTDQTFGSTVLQTQVNAMLEEFRRADCVLQVVDIGGLRADLPAENRRRRVNDDALFYISNETGGELYEDANDFVEQLEKVLESSSLTYLLTFRPSDPGDPGTHHRVKVKLKDSPRRTRLSHRTGYYSPRPYGELHPMEKSLLASKMIVAVEEKNDLDLSVLVAPFRSNERSAYLPVIIEVGGESLLTDHEEDELPVEFYAYVTDENGEMRDFFTQIVALDLRSRRTAFAHTGVKYYGHLELPPGAYLVRVMARNAVTGRSGVHNVRVEVPEYEVGPPDLLPPFFVEDPGSWFLVREQPEEGAQARPYPFTLNGEAYVPSAVPVLQPSEVADLCLVAYNFGEGRLIVDSRVLDAEGSPVAGGELTVKERTITGIRGLDKLAASFSPKGLSKGDYTLEVSVMDPRSQAMKSSSIGIRVSEEGP